MKTLDNTVMIKKKNGLEIPLFISISLFSLLFFLSSTANGQIKSGQAPNIVLIFMDDMGYGDLDLNGAIGYTLPNINKLASQGMRFTNFYAAQPICSASRAGILTGCYPNRIGLTGALFPDSKIGMNSAEETIPEVLKKKGYATSMVGKWHLGDAKEFLPLQHGFDEYFGLPYSNDMWSIAYDGKLETDKSSWRSKVPPLPLIEGNNIIETIQNMDQMNTLTTRYTEKAVSFIERHKGRPFFLYFAHTMPHVPLAVSDKFKGKSEQGLYGDVMMEIDWSVGQIMKILKENDLENNTLVVFTSDNGPWLTFGAHGGSSGGLREGKQTTFEGGQREPAIMRWPGVIPEGTVNNKLASTIDLLPTFAAITEAPLPEKKIDGINILPLFKGNEYENPRDTFYYYYGKNSLEAVREGPWKLVLPHKYKSDEGELPGKDGNIGSRHTDSIGLALYDLRRDPGERYNVLKHNPDVVEKLQKLVERARVDLGDDLTGRPGNNRREPGRIGAE
ncbi:sulfatase family protein [Arenibacter echinorum]|uniref:Arylsulfatase n=1 Tax=Arenibacter echinorum TaxID=440515 RepID=A0A327R0W2_9FLAO|nr:sulfatase [Arenibacter echinorum]RAJ10261.1 arylsulfatase [Arenibacter echinorum]